MSGEYVLILAGNTIEREVLRGMLHGDGYCVFDTDSARAAQRIMDRFPVDAVLVDRGFHSEGFVPFMAHVQARHPQVARVLMTHDPQSLEAMRAMGVGHTHSLLLKPVVEAELLFCLSRALVKAALLPLPASDEELSLPLARFFNRVQPGRS